MSELSSLVKERGIVKAKLTRVKTYFQSVSDRSQVSQLKVRIDKLNNYWSDFDAIQTKIELIDDETDHSVERDNFEADYFSLKSAAEDFIEGCLLQNNNNKYNINVPTSQICSVKLPDIKLPVFDGKYDEWVPFHDTFTSLIHTKQNLPDVHKFYYLKCSVKGEAADTISALESSAENYAVAWQLLTDRYGNKKYLINRHVSALFTLTKTDKSNSVTLRKLLDTALKHVRALKALGQPTEHWDTLLIHLIVDKLDVLSLREWENTLNSDKLPSMLELEKFLHHRCQVLEAVESSVINQPSASSTNKQLHASTNSNSKYHVKNKYISSFHAFVKKCCLCEKSHPIYFCETFKSLSVVERENHVRKLGLCFNCLSGTNHQAPDCKSRCCQLCGKRHNTLLHYPEKEVSAGKPQESSLSHKSQVKTSDSKQLPVQQRTVSSTSNLRGIQTNSVILLSTAIVSIFDKFGTPHLCRALLDSGSQANFITERSAAILKLPKRKVVSEINGISQSTTSSGYSAQCTIKSRINEFASTIDCIILPSITVPLPTVPISKSHLSLPTNLQLADPEFHKSSNIDLLLGAELFFELMCEGKLKSSESTVLQNTVFGWIISGKVPISSNISIVTSVCHLSTLEEINENIQRFWTVEECKSEKQFTGDDRWCENLYEKTKYRDVNGRYWVHIPLKGDIHQLGNSKDTALRRFYSVERRLASNPELQRDYIEFMRDYERLGHMQQITSEEANSTVSYYIPHHPVIKEDSTTTKVRVVFDASCKTTSGISLNDISTVGPKVQSDLWNIIIKFRTHRYVFTSDLEKMYRQIRIDPSQTNLQLILWRESITEDIKIYKLLTVTYGTASAPYLATRTLNQLATDEEGELPIASKVILEDVYVDDLMTGSNSIEDAKQLQHDLIKLAERGGFHFRKWTSNCAELLKNLPTEDVEQRCWQVDQEPKVKTLGLIWNPRKDVFKFLVQPQIKGGDITKRFILGAIGRIFDPLGLIGPVTLIAKLIMQKLWLCQIGWDDEVPDHLRAEWQTYQNSLHLLSDLEIPRSLAPGSQGEMKFELHGFSDSSEAAFGACVYLKAIDLRNNVSVNLITSKTRVAPIKKTTLPRLELCGAVLLAEVTKIAIDSLHLHLESVSYYTDSTIVLAWIRSSSSHWSTFVANRISKIQDLSNIDSWYHIKSSENPADFLSRGLYPQQIIGNSLYWNGPATLQSTTPVIDSSFEVLPLEHLPEKRIHAVHHSAVSHGIDFNRYSTFLKAVRVIAFCLRFANNCRSSQSRNTTSLSVSEIQNAKTVIVKIIQEEAFRKEIKELETNQELNKKASIACLRPYLDKEKLIRVGGRLPKSELHSDQIHPIILPKGHLITELIAKHYHVESLHGGPQLLLSYMRQKYWPIGGRNLARKIFHQCVQCFRTRPKPLSQLMGDLPQPRVKAPPRPFYTAGVDYCGPFSIKHSRRRGTVPKKCYVSLFICFSTKAVHLEVAEDMSAASFMAVLRRFISRRGRPKAIYSDNGTNFVKTNKELRELTELWNLEQFQTKVIDVLACSHIEWHFQPPGAPNFGGLWEASVKLVKSHIKRVVGNTCLTFIEFITFLTQVEACINSRPITEQSEEPSDLLPLTPSHFLIGGILTTSPEPDLKSFPENRLNHWQRTQQMVQHFWSRWSREYLNTLQPRKKWKQSEVNINIDDLVVIKEDNLPPLVWRLARVTKLHPGDDGLVRVVTLRTPSGLLKRPVTKVCPLPKSVNTF